MSQILTDYDFGPADEKNLRRLAEVILPDADRFAGEFYQYLARDPYTASFFKDEAAIRRRRETFRGWLLDLLTGSYREEELRTVFVSERVESALVRWTERLVHGLNLVLTVGLLAMAVGVVSLFAYDVMNAFTTSLEHGVIKALGSLLILWMMIELLHAEISHLKGGRFHVGIFLELALVAFIRKLFVAALEKATPVDFGLLLGALLVLGGLFVMVTRAENHRGSR